MLSVKVHTRKAPKNFGWDGSHVPRKDIVLLGEVMISSCCLALLSILKHDNRDFSQFTNLCRDQGLRVIVIQVLQYCIVG